MCIYTYTILEHQFDSFLLVMPLFPHYAVNYIKMLTFLTYNKVQNTFVHAVLLVYVVCMLYVCSCTLGNALSRSY